MVSEYTPSNSNFVQVHCINEFCSRYNDIIIISLVAVDVQYQDAALKHNIGMKSRIHSALLHVEVVCLSLEMRK